MIDSENDDRDAENLPINENADRIIPQKVVEVGTLLCFIQLPIAVQFYEANQYIILVYSVIATILLPFPFIYVVNAVEDLRRKEGTSSRRRSQYLAVGAIVVAAIGLTTMAIHLELESIERRDRIDSHIEVSTDEGI